MKFVDDSVNSYIFNSKFRSSGDKMLRLELDNRGYAAHTRPSENFLLHVEASADYKLKLLIALHIWTAKEIYDVLGRFGWFYGDFFIQHECAPLELYYTGIYRHVNNPERSAFLRVLVCCTDL